MIRFVSFIRSARVEASEAEAWYLERDHAVGLRFHGELERATLRILENPLQFPVVIKDVRRAQMRGFPYSLLFQIVGERARVIACFHGKRDPRRWQRRS